ncbi:hypothetical protein COW53_03005 [bacterium CG17_big_fil_post_rev_8_21_14_2_50_64_8]|nr:MAG: hypothetical protein COW53_03005 [bacterium CG17_big_fil_post_rev_8_21_14_2_50_64_8]PJA73501.1 MAG: hypothetical protein CO151_13380 [bacterium CG_4_9_14_3_um_filter_65_15]
MGTLIKQRIHSASPRPHPASLAQLALLTIVLVSGPGARVAEGMEVQSFANGITAHIHSPAEISAALEYSDPEGLVLDHPAVGCLALRDDAAIRTPFDPSVVRMALAALEVDTDLTVEVFVLPNTPVEAGGSFSRRGAILLSPGTAAIEPSIQANITTHEMGHILTWACMDRFPGRWEAYMELRGLDPVVNGPTARHADRAREILAEDIRFLFGGPLAVAGGNIENHDLMTPNRIDGLRDLLAGYFADARGPVAAGSSAFPNPCNPLTTIEMVLPDDVSASTGQARLEIFDLRGGRVRTVTGGYQANGRVSLRWDGTTDGGSAAASGRYLYVMHMGEVLSRGAVVLVR